MFVGCGKDTGGVAGISGDTAAVTISVEVAPVSLDAVESVIAEVVVIGSTSALAATDGASLVSTGLIVFGAEWVADSVDTPLRAGLVLC